MSAAADLSRRSVLQLSGAAALAAGRAGAGTRGRTIRAVAFDAFPIFNPKSVFETAHRLAPDRPDLADAWFQKAFSDSWLRTAARRYQPFEAVLAETLGSVAGASAPLSAAACAEMLSAFQALDPWPDVRERLTELRSAGLRLVFVSNLGEATLRTNLRRAGLETLFDAVLSTDRVRAFKPAPQAYALAMRHLRLAREEILFAPFAAWDAAGAAWFGYPTAWVNRAGQRPEPGALAVRTGPDLQVVVDAARG